MIEDCFTIKDYNWRVYSYYDVTNYETDVILAKLQELGCNYSNAIKAYEALNNPVDIGITYSNRITHTSLVVISKTSNACQFLNTLVHEVTHVKSHIATTYNLNEKDEEVCYLVGTIVELMYPKCRKLLCDDCREHCK